LLTGGFGSLQFDLVPDPTGLQQVYIHNGARIHKIDNEGWRIDSTLVDSMSSSFHLSSINPHDTEFLFGIKNGNLAQSDWNTDTTISNTDWNWSRNTEFFYTEDSTVVFARDYKKGDYQKVLESVLYRSTESGKSGTWQRIKIDSAVIAFDSNRRGSKVYMSKDSTLLMSDDYGTEFESVEHFEKRITGIYKPDTSHSVLYVSTISDIWKLVNDDKVKSVKHVIADISDQRPISSINYKLADNYPNPFNPSTNIQFSLPQAEQVTINIYNSIGQKIETLLNRQMTAGSHSVTFDARGLPSGVYIYRLKAGDYRESKKMLLVK
jgi:hypothetical protein